MQQQQLIVFITLFFTTTYSTKINFFDAHADVPILGNQSTVYATHIELWADVTDCPPPSCSCKVQTNATDNNEHNVKFSDVDPNKGHVEIENLQPNTLYSFSLTCVGSIDTVTRNIRTDYGRPSAPQNFIVILKSKRLSASWSSPLLPAGPINNYKLTINQNEIIDNLPNNVFSYDMTEDYAYGEIYKFVLVACNRDRRNDTYCSSPNDATYVFVAPVTITTPTSESSTKPNSTNILSYSILLSIFIFCFLFFSQMKY